MAERYPSFISPTDSKPDAAPTSVSDACVLSHAPVEESIQGSSSASHQQVSPQPYDVIYHNPTTHGNSALWTDPPVDLGNSPIESALGIDGLTSPYSLTSLYDNSLFFGNDNNLSFRIPPASSQCEPSYPPRSLDSAHYQNNDIYPYNPYNQGHLELEPSVSNGFYREYYPKPPVQTLQFQHDIAHTLAVPPTSGAPQVGEYSATSSLWPNSSSLSTPDGRMSVPLLSSGSSPSLSQHHPTPSSVSSSSILYTPDQSLRHPESCYQPFPYIADHTSSPRRPTGSLTSRHFVQNASRPSTMEIKQPKATLKTLQVSGYRKIAPAPPGRVKPQGESPSRQAKRRVRRESKETPDKPLGLSHKSITQSLPAGTVVFTRPLTPTTVHEHSFDTSSRKIDEKIIERVGVNFEAGHSIAPKVQEELWESNTPTHVRAHATERTLAIGQVFSQQRRGSKEAKAGGRTSASSTGIRFSPAKPQNTSTLPTLGKRQMRHTTISNSSQNSSKTPARRSRTNSHEDQKLTYSSTQQISDSFEGRTRSVRKNFGRVGGETSAATSVPRTERATLPTRVSSSRIGVPVSKQRGFVPLGGGADAVERALGRPGLGSTQKKSMSYRKSPSHSPGCWEAANGLVMGSAAGSTHGTRRS